MNIFLKIPQNNYDMIRSWSSTVVFPSARSKLKIYRKTLPHSRHEFLIFHQNLMRKIYGIKISCCFMLLLPWTFAKTKILISKSLAGPQLQPWLRLRLAPSFTVFHWFSSSQQVEFGRNGGQDAPRNIFGEITRKRKKPTKFSDGNLFTDHCWVVFVEFYEKHRRCFEIW